MTRDTQTFHSNTLLRPILIACILLILVIAAAGVAVAAMPPVPYFSQCDSRWGGGDKLGGDGPTIRDAGCALTSAAMVMAYYGVDTDPKRLNDDIGRDGSADLIMAFCEPDDRPVTLGRDGDGDDNIGLYRPGSTTDVFYLDIDNDGGSADIVTPEYGDLGDIPIAGDWDGDSDDNIRVYRPGTGEFFLDATVPEVSASKTIYVDDDFDDEPSEHKWDMIQEGVNDASDGDTVIVYAGEYCENVDVNKSITLEGEGADVVTVRTADASDHVFEVTADWVNISGFAVAGATATYYVSGIYISNANNCNISDNNVSNNYGGISLWSSNNTMLQNNTANSNDNYGICIDHSNNNTLSNNTANSNDRGIYLWDSNNNTLRGNTASNNIVLDDRDYTGSGIQLVRSNNNTLQGNTMNLNSEVGIYLWCYSNNNTLIDNTISNSNYVGIHLDSSSSNNILYHNNIINNTLCNAYDECTNQWDSGSAGNYYSDYNGTDPDGDGIGEDPHPIPGGGSVDRFPLMQPWTGGTPKIGDLNGDDRITSADASIALAIAAGGSASCDAATLDAADVSGDGRATSLDVLMILQAAAGAIEL